MAGGVIYKKQDVEILQQITDIKFNIFKLKNKLGNNKRISKKLRKWTVEDVEFLINNWGIMTKKELATALNRSVMSISIYSTKLGLRNMLLYNDNVSICMLAKMLHQLKNYSWLEYILTKYNAPLFHIAPKNELTIKAIKLQDFVNWLEHHKHIIDIGRSEDGCFGNEPNWLKEKREADKRAYAYMDKRNWTQEEQDLIIDMINKGYSYRDISIKSKRTGGALKRFFKDKGIKMRPVRASRHNKWTDEQLELVKDLWLKGYKPCIIQEYLPKSDIAISEIIRRNNYYGVPIKFREV